ncbi:hypothetical protein ACWDOP_14005 [Nocardia sp. NPDC003693]
MTTTEARVLKVLSLGGQLTAEQIARHSGTSIRNTEHALRALRYRGHVRGPDPLRAAWAISDSGARFTRTAHGKATLDVPVVAS